LIIADGELGVSPQCIGGRAQPGDLAAIMQELRIFDLACQRIEMQMAIRLVEEVDIETIAILGQATVGRSGEVGLGAADDAARLNCSICPANAP
jgi:hypothetical protein